MDFCQSGEYLAAQNLLLLSGCCNYFTNDLFSGPPISPYSLPPYTLCKYCTVPHFRRSCKHQFYSANYGANMERFMCNKSNHNHSCICRINIVGDGILYIIPPGVQCVYLAGLVNVYHDRQLPPYSHHPAAMEEQCVYLQLPLFAMQFTGH